MANLKNFVKKFSLKNNFSPKSFYLINFQPNLSLFLGSNLTVINTNLKTLKTHNSLWVVNQLNFKTQPNHSLFNLGYFYQLIMFIETFSIKLLLIFKKSLGEGFLIIRGLCLVFFIDALIIDDEPLWEPIEWSMVQSWILFIFLFGWIAENLVVSRYGSYTGRDKRVWFSWYKTFWLVDMWFVLSFGAATLFVIVPFYYEVNYLMCFTQSWWNWYSRVFFFKFISLYVWVLFLAYTIQINLRWFNWKKIFLLVLVINFFLSYLLYTHFFMSFFSYFTNTNWYNSTRMVDYVQLSHEPNKWSWGNKKTWSFFLS